MRDTLVDRIAKAIHKSSTGKEDGWANEVNNAYAALEAMMEPTKPMIVAECLAKDAWDAMIRAAITEGSSLDHPVEEEEEE